MVHPLLPVPRLYRNLGVILAVYGFMTSDWRPEQRYWQNRDTVNVGLDSSVGRAPARQSGGRKFKSRSSQVVFVHPNLSKICTQSVSLVVYYMTFIYKKSYPFMVHPLLPVPRSYRNLGVIPG